MRDYLEEHDIPCVRRSGDSIQIHLFALLTIQPSISERASTAYDHSKGNQKNNYSDNKNIHWKR